MKRPLFVEMSSVLDVGKVVFFPFLISLLFSLSTEDCDSLLKTNLWIGNLVWHCPHLQPTCVREAF